MDPSQQLFCAIGVGGDGVVTYWHRSGTKAATRCECGGKSGKWRQPVAKAETWR